MYTASEKGDVELAKLLLNVEGFDFNEVENGSGTPSLQKGTTSLAVASWMGHHKIVKLLIQSKDYRREGKAGKEEKRSVTVSRTSIDNKRSKTSSSSK
ncbi:hypothetical protein TL16_g08869 [Triparma laevis f. inornata]|uniref:Uncharacterized protein n=1 Tax=Triparma laevis f. inornata TaxID=1714386 RepID=A0A9W7B6G1_9STRA|nr:hypothetical protein TL16_g08869 [Triparma laevis f. inornata]